MNNNEDERVEIPECARVVSAASRPIERECRDGDACSLKDFKPDQAAGVNSITVICV